MDSDDEYNADSAGEDGEQDDDDFVADEDDDEEEEYNDDSGASGSDSDRPKRKSVQPRTRAAATRRSSRGGSVNYREDSDDDGNGNASDDDDDAGGGSSDESDDRQQRRARSSRGAGSSRPQRQAAQVATRRGKRSYEESEEADEDDDEQYARQLDREINGLRSRPRRATSTTPTEPPPRITFSSRSNSRPAPQQQQPQQQARKPQRSSRRSAARVSYAESDDSSDEDAGRNGRQQKEIQPAFDDASAYDDEVEKVLSHRDIEGMPYNPYDPWGHRELLIKWKRYSHIHCSWDSVKTLKQLGGYKRVLNYVKKIDDQEAERALVSREEQELRDVEREMEQQLVAQHSQVERVVAERQPEEEGQAVQYLVKWEGLPYSECTWEKVEDIQKAGAETQMAAFHAREARLQEPSSTVEAQRKQFLLQSTRALEKQPEFLRGGKLRDYQLDGLNWMVYSWSQDRNVILADEMGLGKTVQCVSFVGYMSQALNIRGPFLVVVPLSTVPNWIREFRRWVPEVNTVVYVGDSRSREVIRAFEFDPETRLPTRQKRFEVIITTYELVLKDAAILGRIKWAYLLVDEAHRLKNAESALFQELINWNFGNKLLVTGTPLQNSLKELWALLHFLEPTKFDDGGAFEDEYQLETMDGVSGLHSVLRPHLLRRVIKDVEKSLPPKNERILRVELTPLQKQYYKWILTRNFKELNKGIRGGGNVTLLNIIGELKKCCNHPFLFESAEENYRLSDTDRSAIDRLIVTSGKMVLLDKLMKRLRETGHRVLIFSQMVRVLDIISDYLRLRGFPHQRLDGSTPAAARHASMEHFNKPDSPDFAFLLSTRAGGLGINLATADTVIIFDSDWNPQNDLQAMSRAHRIGQTETVNIYRFVTGGSVEEDILERAKQKMVLDHLVIQRMDTSGRTVLDPAASKNSAKQMFGKDELAAILRFGAEELFKSDQQQDNADDVKRMYEEDIDAILARAEVVDTSRATYDAGVNEDLLNSFNVATFKNDEDDAAFWSRLIPVSTRPKDEDSPEDLLPRAARLKAAGSADVDEDAGKGRAARAQQRGAAKGSRVGGEPGPPVDGAVLRIDEWLTDVDDQGVPLRPKQDDDGGEAGVGPGSQQQQPIIRTLTRRDANAFVRGVRRYGLISRIDDVCGEVGKGVEEAAPGARLALWHTLMDGCRRAVQISEAQREDAKDAILDFFGSPVKASELVAHCGQMRLLARRVESLKDPAAQFKLDAFSQLPVPKWGKALNWSTKDDAMLLLGVYRYGLGHWEQVAADEALGLADKLASVVGPKQQQPSAGGEAEGEGDKSTLPKASHIETRVLGLLRKMHAANKASAPGSKMRSILPKPSKPSKPSAREGGSKAKEDRDRSGGPST